MDRYSFAPYPFVSKYVLDDARFQRDQSKCCG